MIAVFEYNVVSNAASFARASTNPLVAMDMTLYGGLDLHQWD